MSDSGIFTTVIYMLGLGFLSLGVSVLTNKPPMIGVIFGIGLIVAAVHRALTKR